jgi:hypothetical protein
MFSGTETCWQITIQPARAGRLDVVHRDDPAAAV